MPTPLPAKKPVSGGPAGTRWGESAQAREHLGGHPQTPGASEPAERGVLSSRTSAKLEPSDPNQATTLEPGTIIAERYRIDSLLGEGGMGKVYAAEHVHMRKQVAIKVLHTEMSTTPEVVARFEREAIAAGKITHPNVAAATDFGRLEDRSFFLVLEYVAGVDLRAILRAGAVAPARALNIIRQIAAAVGAAHAAGVVHRDLKPENIMLVDRDGEPDFVKVLDFGIAKIDAIGIADGSGGASSASGPSVAQPLTKMGAVFGTPDYMSPEQALGQPTDARSDLYSIGVMFYELLTGQRPFKGGAVTLMRKHVLEDAPSLPAATIESVGPRFDPLIQKLLKKSAQDRFSSAAELIVALSELDQEPAPGSPGSTAAPPRLGPTTVVAQSARVASAGPAAPFAMTMPDSLLAERSEVTTPKRKPRYGLTFLVVVALGVGCLYWLGISPRALLGSALAGRAPKPLPLPASVAISSEPSVDVASSSPPTPATEVASAFPVDSAGLTEANPLDSDEANAVPSPDDSATTAATAPHHSGPHVIQPRPGAKPIHKATKGAPPPKRGGIYIPPPSQWWKN